MALLIFSTSQISTYEFGPAATQFGLTVFGFTLGLWGIVRYTGKPVGFIIMLTGGLIASWTAATGVIAWVIFLAAMILLGFKKLIYYIGWLVFTCLINFPYLYFLVIYRKPGVNAVWNKFLDLRLLVNYLGRPLADGIGSSTGYLPTGELAGWLGLALGGMSVLLLMVQGKRLILKAVPALMLMAYGLSAAWQTSIFRVMIAPWYTSIVMPYWIGLAGLAFLFLVTVSREAEIVRSRLLGVDKVGSIIGPIILISLAGLYLSSNLTYRDKSFFLTSRSPIAASCLRNYDWAPTYCERRVFQWPVNRVYMSYFGWLLQRHHLNVFSRHQVWSMQGDTILGSVYSPEAPVNTRLEWYDGLPGNPGSDTDYRHLNLSVTPFRSVVWRVSLPANLSSVEFRSAIGAGSSDHSQSPVTFNVYIAPQGGLEKLIYSQTLAPRQVGWKRFSLDLLSYQGQVINIRLAVSAGSVSAPTLYKFPYLDLNEMPGETLVDKPEVLPSNTELSPLAPKTQAADYIFNLNTAEVHGLIQVDGASKSWHVEQNPYLNFKFEPPLDLAVYGWMSFTISASADIPTRGAEVFLYFEAQSQPVHLVIPILADSGAHTYTYPLRLVDIPGKLTALQLHPIMIPSMNGANVVTITDVRLIHLP